MWVAATPLNYSHTFIIKRFNYSSFRVRCSDTPRGFGSQDDTNVNHIVFFFIAELYLFDYGWLNFVVMVAIFGIFLYHLYF